MPPTRGFFLGAGPLRPAGADIASANGPRPERDLPGRESASYPGAGVRAARLPTYMFSPRQTDMLSLIPGVPGGMPPPTEQNGECNLSISAWMSTCFMRAAVDVSNTNLLITVMASRPNARR